jgi:hypothetical protein
VAIREAKGKCAEQRCDKKLAACDRCTPFRNEYRMGRRLQFTASHHASSYVPASINQMQLLVASVSR